MRRLVSGVTASLALIEAAVADGADAILVHHGLFWRGQSGCITGWMRQRLAPLLAHDINLFAYHLPLDAHAELGNNAQLGQRLGLRADARFGDQDLGCIGPAAAAVAAALAARGQDAVGGAVPGRAPAADRGSEKGCVSATAWPTARARSTRGSAAAAVMSSPWVCRR